MLSVFRGCIKTNFLPREGSRCKELIDDILERLGYVEEEECPEMSRNVPLVSQDLNLDVQESRKPRTPETDPIKLRLFALFNRRVYRMMDAKEQKAFKTADVQDEDLTLVEDYYADPHPEWDGKDFRRRDLVTLLNNWQGEVDKAEAWKAFPPPKPKPAPIFARSI